MDVRGKVVVVTGGADGIGKALCERFHKEGAGTRGGGRPQRRGGAAGCRIGCRPGIRVRRRQGGRHLARGHGDRGARQGPIALFCSNAGMGDFKGTPESSASSPNEQWERGWAVNVMAHVYAARALVPRMAAQGRRLFSQHHLGRPGLLNQIGNAVYGTTKHAAVGFAENLAFTHRDRGNPRLHPVPARGRHRAAARPAGADRSTSTACSRPSRWPTA